jgi:hypothetical protein
MFVYFAVDKRHAHKLAKFAARNNIPLNFTALPTAIELPPQAPSPTSNIERLTTFIANHRTNTATRKVESLARSAPRSTCPPPTLCPVTAPALRPPASPHTTPPPCARPLDATPVVRPRAPSPSFPSSTDPSPASATDRIAPFLTGTVTHLDPPSPLLLPTPLAVAPPPCAPHPPSTSRLSTRHWPAQSASDNQLTTQYLLSLVDPRVRFGLLTLPYQHDKLVSTLQGIREAIHSADQELRTLPLVRPVSLPTVP